MLLHPTLERLAQLRLTGMANALQEQLSQPDIATLSFEERLGLLLDREATERENRRLKTRLKQAKLRQSAAIEDIDYRAPRGLDKALMTRLATGQWIGEHLNVLITGPTGVGQIALADSAIPHAIGACRACRACRACSRSSASPAPMAATASCLPSWPRPICSSSTIGGWHP